VYTTAPVATIGVARIRHPLAKMLTPTNAVVRRPVISFCDFIDSLLSPLDGRPPWRNAAYTIYSPTCRVFWSAEHPLPKRSTFAEDAGFLMR
jgi:hypothetical protein